MSGLDPARILSAWEAGQGLRPLDRALSLIWWAGYGGEFADQPLAVRDKLLLEIRSQTFGPRMDLVTNCPDCGAELELSLETRALVKSLEVPKPEQLETPIGPVQLRPLTSRDLAAAAGLPDPEIAAYLRGRITEMPVPPELHQQVDAAIERREAKGQITLALNCAECGAVWREPLDILAHFWSEIEAAARRSLGEVAELARAFGWSEAQILALSPFRRAAYLSLARAG